MAVDIDRLSEEWTIQPGPLKGELFSSWICRLAWAKRLNPNHLFEGLRTYNRDIDIRPYEWLLEDLTKFTRVSEEEIRGMLLDHWDDLLHKFKRGGYPIGVIGRPHYKTQGIRICPECLKDDTVPYYRKIWRVGVITACTKHKCLLVDRCPECQSFIDPKRVGWKDSPTSCFNCGFDLRESPVLSIQAGDPFFGAVGELGSLGSADKIFKVFKLARLLWDASSLEDECYKGHPLTKKPSMKRLFNGDRKPLFAHVEAVYLIVGASWALLDDDGALTEILNQNNSCPEHFWTDTPYCCHHNDHNKVFKSKFNFARHVNSHIGIKPYICPKCGQSFTQKKSMQTHKRKCRKTVFAFANKNTFFRHLKTHEEEKEFKCPECDYECSDKNYLKEHMNIHGDKRPCKCPKCGERFNFKNYLNNHIRKVHLKEKHHICPVCGQKIAWLSSYVRHMRSHRGEKPYKCNGCGGGFAHRASLNKHMKHRCPSNW